MSDNIKVGICRCHRHYTPSYIYKTVVLKPNYCCHDNKNILTQEQLSEKNVKYVIKYNFSLGGETITVPENCILEFDGGSLSSGTIVGQNTVFINVGDVDIWGDNLTKEGTWIEHSGGGGGEPSEYIKNASISADGNTLTLTKKDETTVTFTPEDEVLLTNLMTQKLIVVLEERLLNLRKIITIFLHQKILTKRILFILYHMTLILMMKI